MQYQELRDAVARAERDGVLRPESTVTVHLNDEEDQHHSSPACPGVRRSVEVRFSDLVRIPPITWCDCGGWLTTRPGQLLRQAVTEYRMLDLERQGWVAGSWPELEKTMRNHGRDILVGRRNRNGQIEELMAEGRAAAESVLRRSMRRMGNHELQRMLAAQGMRIEVDPLRAERFANWAKRRRIDQERRSYDQEFDDLLREQMATSAKRLVAVTRGNSVSWLDTPGVPRELALLVWERHPDQREVLWNMHTLVAEGIAALGLRMTGCAVAADREDDPVVLETLKTLWFENPGNWVSLDEALTAARNLR
jgi:hypothetical protein